MTNGKIITRRKTCCSTCLSTTNPTMISLQFYPYLMGYKRLLDILEKEMLLRKTKCRWEGNIKMLVNIEEIVSVFVEWIGFMWFRIETEG